MVDLLSISIFSILFNPIIILALVLAYFYFYLFLTLLYFLLNNLLLLISSSSLFILFLSFKIIGFEIVLGNSLVYFLVIILPTLENVALLVLDIDKTAKYSFIIL